MADDYRDDNTTTGVLTTDAVLTGRIDATFDTDWFRFDARAGAHYRFSVLQPSSQDAHGATIAPMLSVYDANGHILPIYDNGILEPASDGTYYVGVYNGGTQGNYAIRATALTDDYGASNQAAPLLWAGGGISGTLNYANDVDRFKVSLSADNYYTFKLAGASQASTDSIMLNITSATGEYLGWVNPVYTAEGVRLTILASVSGDFYVDAIHRGFGSGQPPISYTLNVSSPFKDEYGNSPSTSASAQLGTPVSGALQNAADVDMFKVTLVAGRTYGISWNSAAPGSPAHERISMEVSDASGNVIGAMGYTDATYATVTPSATGEHYVSLRGREGNYDMTIAPAKDDYTANTSTTGRLVIGREMAGQLEMGGSDRDWFAVRLNAGTTYWLSANSPSYAYGKLRLLDSTGKELLESSNPGSSTFAETVAYVPSRSGTYYVEISSNFGSPTSYTVSAKIGERDDHGGTPAAATPLELGKPIAGKLEITRDTDTFKFSTEAGKTYGFLPTGAGGNYVTLNASDAGGAYVPLGYWSGAGESKVYTATSTGDIYITVSGYTAGQYTLNATEFSLDDFSADASSAGILAANGSIQGTLSNPVDRDALRVSLQAGKSYVFELLGALSGNGTLETSSLQFSVSGANSNPVQEVWLRDSAEPRIMVTPSSSGDYLVNVSSYSGQMGSYKVKAITLSGDATGPTLVAQSHAHNADNIPLTSSKIELSFNEPIAIDRAAITLTDSMGQPLALSYVPGPASPYASDNKLVFNVGAMLKPGTYTLNLPREAVHDLAGNAHQGPETLTFTTVMPSTVSTDGADLLTPNPGGTIDGGAGIDIAYYGSDVHVQQILRNATGATVTNYQNAWMLRNDTLVNVERVFVSGTAFALDVDGTAGQVYRLYRAAFDRTPESGGLGVWMDQRDKGVSLKQLASQMLSQSDSIALYGDNSSDTDFVIQLYQKVLDREPDAAGLQAWVNVLANGTSRAEVLTGFSESVEHIGTVANLIGEGFWYLPLL